MPVFSFKEHSSVTPATASQVTNGKLFSHFLSVFNVICVVHFTEMIFVSLNLIWLKKPLKERGNGGKKVFSKLNLHLGFILINTEILK